MAIPGFLFGGDTGLTQDQLAKRRQVLDAMLARGVGAPRNVGEGLTALGEALAYRMEKNSLAEGEEASKGRRASVMDGILGGNISPLASVDATVSASGASPSVDMAGEPIDMSGNDVYSGFMDTVKAGGVQNPYALAAIAATGKAESGFDPGNVNRTWSDPSQSGKPGTAGGIMSWRGPRYDALAATGDLSPQGQAKFFLQEDPTLIASLNKAQSVDEAQGLMNRAWAFAGYDKPGGETANRLSYANSFLPQFQGQGGPEEPVQVASLDPAAGMPAMTPGQAIEQQAPLPMPEANASLTDEVAQFQQTPEYAAQFPGRAAVASAVEQKGIPVGPQPQFTPAVQQVGQAVMAKQQPAATPQTAQAAQPVQMAQAATGGPSLQQLYAAAASQDITDQDRSVVNSLIEQKLGEQRAARDQQTWTQRQAYEREQLQADPLYQQKLAAGQLDFETAQNGQWSRLDDGRLYNQRTGEVKDAPTLPNGATGEKYFGNPIAIQTQDGVKYGQIGDRGGFKEISIGEGNTFAPPTKTVDTETEQLIYDNFGNLLSRVPKQNREKARETAIGKVEGETQGAAQAGVASARLVGKQITDQIDDVLEDPNLAGAVGSIQGRLPSFRQGSVDFDKKLERLQGQAFLQAREFLKGQGPITDFESRKAEAASVQLSTAQSEDQFKQALQDFRDAVASGVQKAELAAGQGKASPASQSTNVDDLLKKYGTQ
jgi:hypothetical protein